ncbi:MAG: hypothetical protein M0T84_08515 [Betaproteobacteria bacterium]|nr:hypothetical protein [Betaproteobacteria bacterium]
MNDMRVRLAHAWRHDRRALWIRLIKVANAVAFAILIRKPVGWKLGLWCIFCAISLAVAVRLEKSGVAQGHPRTN